MRSYVILMEDYAFLLTNSGHFIECCFQFVLLGAVLVGINCLVFQKELVIEGSLPTPPYIQHHFLWMETSLRCGWWWFISLLHNHFHSTLSYSIHFSSPITISFKSETFSLCWNRETQVEMWSRIFSSTYLEPKHQGNQHKQAGSNDFQCLVWIFSVCRLSLVWYGVDCSQFDCYQLQMIHPTMEHCPVRNLQHETLQTDQFITVSSLYTA